MSAPEAHDVVDVGEAGQTPADELMRFTVTELYALVERLISLSERYEAEAPLSSAYVGGLAEHLAGLTLHGLLEWPDGP